MSKCGNCGTNLSCGCQKRVSKSGVSGCTTCINKLNLGAQVAPPVKEKVIVSPKVTAFGDGRYKNLKKT
jgi:hypothetical protein